MCHIEVISNAVRCLIILLTFIDDDDDSYCVNYQILGNIGVGVRAVNCAEIALRKQ